MPPAARRGHSAVLHEESSSMVVFGGLTGNGEASDVWVMNLAGTHVVEGGKEGGR